MKGMNDSLEVETVSEKGIEENSSVSNQRPVRKTVAFTETENPVRGQGWRGGRRRQRTPLWIHLVGRQGGGGIPEDDISTQSCESRAQRPTLSPLFSTLCNLASRFFYRLDLLKTKGFILSSRTLSL